MDLPVIYTELEYQRLNTNGNKIMLLMDCILIHPTLFEEHLMSFSQWGARYVSENRAEFKRIRKEYGLGKSNIDFLDHYFMFEKTVNAFHEENIQDLIFCMHPSYLFPKFLMDRYTTFEHFSDSPFSQEEEFFLMLSPYYLNNWLMAFLNEAQNLDTQVSAFRKYNYLRAVMQGGMEVWRQRFKEFIDHHRIKLPKYLLGEDAPYQLKEFTIDKTQWDAGEIKKSAKN